MLQKTNPYKHFFKLFAIDIAFIWILALFVIFAAFMLFGAGADSYISLYPNLYAITFFSIIWFIATLPFFNQYIKYMKKGFDFIVKKRNYKFITIFNTLIFFMTLMSIIIKPL